MHFGHALHKQQYRIEHVQCLYDIRLQWFIFPRITTRMCELDRDVCGVVVLLVFLRTWTDP
jgi:hypothetical protein